MSDNERASFDATAYWNKRYGTIDATKSGHIDLPAEYNAWLYRRKQDHVAKAVVKVGGTLRGSKLLEVAAGSGAWMNFWKAHGVGEYLGIDLSERAVDSLIQRFPQYRFLQCDLNDPGLLAAIGENYDCITAIDVLYHVLDDARFADVVCDLAKALKPGGLLVVHDIFTHAAPIDHGQYIRWRTLKQYQTVLKAAGFEIVYRRPTFLFMVQNSDFTGMGGKMLDLTWRHLTYPLVSRLPGFAGVLTYLADSIACALLREGPSMEFMICRKRG